MPLIFYFSPTVASSKNRTPCTCEKARGVVSPTIRGYARRVCRPPVTSRADPVPLPLRDARQWCPPPPPPQRHRDALPPRFSIHPSRACQKFNKKITLNISPFVWKKSGLKCVSVAIRFSIFVGT